MQYEIDHTKRYNYLYLQFKDDELLTVTYNNTSKSFTIRISSNDDKYIHHVRTKNSKSVKSIAEALIYDRSGIIFDFRYDKILELNGEMYGL